MLFKKAAEYCKKTGIDTLLKKADTVIVGFSGGADSRVLLSFFLSERKNLPSLKIIAAHVNHMIRGDEADRDEAFCKEICEKEGIPLEIAHIDIPKAAEESGKGLEEAAREARYAFFGSLSKKYPNSLTATAHNADDNLETVIFNLARGSGTKGISGIAPVRDEKLIRPLLSCTSEEIRSFASKNVLSFVQDSTNRDRAYTRNAIRHGIVPLLREINPKAADAAGRLADAAREDCNFIEAEADKFLSSAPLTREALRALHPALFQRVITKLYRRARGSCDDLSTKNIFDCKKLILSTEAKSISLPHGLALFAEGNEVFIKKDPRFDPPAPKEALEKAVLFENTPLSFGTFCIICTETENYINTIDENVYNLSLHERIDCDKINGNLFVRQRRPGDTLRKGGMSKKLKKLLCENAVPVRIRDSLPVIEDSDGILLAPFIGVRDGARANRSSKKALTVYIFMRELTT